LGLSLNANKFLTKAILKQAGLPVPKFQLFINQNNKLDESLNFPLIVKLNESHGSLEIDQGAVVENKKLLRNRIKYLIDKYKQSVIVEEYIRGKEITVLYINTNKRKIILAEERIFFKKQKYPLYDYESAWGEKEIYDCSKYKINKIIKNDIIHAFDLLHFKDYGRFEIIIDKKNKYYFIDPNANPAFGPYGTTSGPFGYLLHINNIPFIDVLKDLIYSARLRFNKQF
jgi:D-alanine-D-alanine ligase